MVSGGGGLLLSKINGLGPITLPNQTSTSIRYLHSSPLGVFRVLCVVPLPFFLFDNNNSSFPLVSLPVLPPHELLEGFRHCPHPFFDWTRAGSTV